MIFAFLEDGTLELFDDAAAAARQYEGVDVESGTVRFYDAAGTPLEPRFSRPNRSGRLFGRLGWVTSGAYVLEPNTTADSDPFALALHEAVSLAPNRWFAGLAEVRAALARQGVAVDMPRQTDRPAGPG